MILSQSTIVNRTSQEIFDYYADFTRHKEFISMLEATEIKTPGPLALGTKIVERGDMLLGSSPMEMLSEIKQFVPGKRITCVSIDGGNEIEQDFIIEPINANSCKVTYTTKVTPPSMGILKAASMALSPFLKAKIKRQLEKDLGRFKDLMEGGHDKKKA